MKVMVTVLSARPRCLPLGHVVAGPSERERGKPTWLASRRGNRPGQDGVAQTGSHRQDAHPSACAKTPREAGPVGRATAHHARMLVTPG